jgi:hypothetical protein
MTIQIDELTTSVDVVATPAAAAAAQQRGDSLAERERARCAAERAARIARRTQAEGYDD